MILLPLTRDQDEDIRQLVQGQEIDLSQLSNLADINAIKKLYNINEKEAAVSTLEDSVISRIIGRDHQ
jgi:hypothetical protein